MCSALYYTFIDDTDYFMPSVIAERCGFRHRSQIGLHLFSELSEQEIAKEAD